MAEKHSIPSHPRFIDHTGDRFGRWTVLSYHTNTAHRQYRWFCRCDCGTKRSVLGYMLRAGRSTSCGCWKDQKTGARSKTHGRSGSPEHNAWMHMNDRCYNKSSKEYRSYGGRGIRVCLRWRRSFANFFKDMGSKISPQHSLDRVDNNGNYEPSNCRWATRKQQARNTRTSRFLTHSGVRACVAQWAEWTGISQTSIYQRLRRGWSVHRTLTIPVTSHSSR